MTKPSVTVDAGRSGGGHLEANAINVTEGTIIGMATSAPAASVGLTLAALAAATAYGSGPSIILMGIAMFIIANAYRKLNMWEANAGASFEWVGRAINPYLGFLTGWLMVAAFVIGTLSGVEVLAPSVLAVFGSNSTATWGNIGIDTALGLIMIAIAVIGIKLTARTQIGMAIVEYAILIVFAIIGFVWVLSHHHGVHPITSGWASFSGEGGKGSLTAGLLTALFMYTGWDAAIYVNEETQRRRINPGRAVLIAVALLTVVYFVATVGLQGVVSPKALQANAADAPVYIAQVIGGSGWAKVMALSICLSAIASTGAGIVVTARIVMDMANRRVLPPVLGKIDRRTSTPVVASVVVGLLVVILTWIYLLATSVQNAFDDVVNITALLFAIFYILTAVATIVYYRRRVVANAKDGLLLGVLPVAAAAFLVWVLVKSLQEAPASQRWSVLGIVLAGVVLMFVARFVLRSDFFDTRLETGSREETAVTD